MQLVQRRRGENAACPITGQWGAHHTPPTKVTVCVFGAGNAHLMSHPVSSRSSAYQWDFCLEREAEHLQEGVQTAFPLSAPPQLPLQEWGMSRAAWRGAGALDGGETG